MALNNDLWSNASGIELGLRIKIHASNNFCNRLRQHWFGYVCTAASFKSCSRKLTSRQPEFGNIVPGDFTPVMAKHTKSFNLIDTLSVGVDRIQRNFEPLHRQVELWRKTQITDDTAKLIFYSAFVDGKLEEPRSLLPEVQTAYSEPSVS